jgi:hypothetical protein
MSTHVAHCVGAVNRNRPPGFNAIATRRTSSRCAPAESRNIRPTATIPSNVRPKKDESSTGSHAASARGKRLRNSAIKLGDASIPQTVHPSFISAAEIGTPCPQPRSSTDAPAGSNLAHSRTVTTPMVDRSRPAISSAATASYPFDLSPDAVRFMFFSGDTFNSRSERVSPRERYAPEPQYLALFRYLGAAPAVMTTKALY